MRFKVAVAFFACIIAPLSSKADQVRVRVVEYAPFYFQQGNQWTGLEVELASAIIKEAGLTPQFLDLPWSRSIEMLKSGDLDLMMGVTPTEDRKEFLDFIGPERSSRTVLVVSKADTGLAVHNLDDLAAVVRTSGKPIGIQQGAKYAPDFDARLASDTDFAKYFDAVPRGALLAQKVTAGRNLGFFADGDYVAYQLNTNAEWKELALHGFGLPPLDLFCALSRKVAAGLKEKLTAGFQKAEANGSLAAIRAKYTQAKP